MKNRERVFDYLYAQHETVGLDDRGSVIHRLYINGKEVDIEEIELVIDETAHLSRAFDFTQVKSASDKLFYFLNESNELFTMDLQPAVNLDKSGWVDFDRFNESPELRQKINIKKISLA